MSDDIWHIANKLNFAIEAKIRVDKHDSNRHIIDCVTFVVACKAYGHI